MQQLNKFKPQLQLQFSMWLIKNKGAGKPQAEASPKLDLQLPRHDFI